MQHFTSRQSCSLKVTSGPFTRQLAIRRGHAVSCFVIWMATLATADAQDLIFSDSFESGDVSGWSSFFPVPPTGFRFTDLDLRDPHVFVDLAPFCVDFTDTPIPVVNLSFNGSIEDLITIDDDGDGLLDLSLLLLFRPLDTTTSDERVDLAGGLCSAPIETTICTPDPLVPPVIANYDSLAEGTCLAPVPGTTSGYTPAVMEPTGPCFVTDPETVLLELGGLSVPLQETRIAGTWSGGDPPTGAQSGMLTGFLTEADADLLILPADLPIIGGQPLSTLLPGGTGNCDSGDDRDLLDGAPGWWFYLNFSADQVVYLGS